MANPYGQRSSPMLWALIALAARDANSFTVPPAYRPPLQTSIIKAPTTTTTLRGWTNNAHRASEIYMPILAPATDAYSENLSKITEAWDLESLSPEEFLANSGIDPDNGRSME